MGRAVVARNQGTVHKQPASRPQRAAGRTTRLRQNNAGAPHGGVLRPLSAHAALETPQIHNVAGVLSQGAGLVASRPFRTPHQTISDTALVGSVPTMMQPGEANLAHNGVLSWTSCGIPGHVLELLWRLFEERSVIIARSLMTLTFSREYLLVSAMNPCPSRH